MQEALGNLDLASRNYDDSAHFSTLPQTALDQSMRFLQMHVMDNVRQRIEAGHKDFVDEIRVCTLLFMGFPSLKVVLSDHHLHGLPQSVLIACHYDQSDYHPSACLSCRLTSFGR